MNWSKRKLRCCSSVTELPWDKVGQGESPGKVTDLYDENEMHHSTAATGKLI